MQVRDCAFTILPRAWCCSCREAPPGTSACCLAARILVMLQCCTSGCVQVQLCATWHVQVSTRCVVCPACAVASCVLHPHKDGCHLEECVASCTAPWVLRAVGTSTSLDCAQGSCCACMIIHCVRRYCNSLQHVLGKLSACCALCNVVAAAVTVMRLVVGTSGWAAAG